MSALEALIAEIKRLQTWFVRQTSRPEPSLDSLVAAALAERQELLDALKECHGHLLDCAEWQADIPGLAEFDDRIRAALAKHKGDRR